MSTSDQRLEVRRFQRINGQEIRLYCRRLKYRCGESYRFALYEDHAGRYWFEVNLPGESHLEPLSTISFEEQVARELLVLGLNKYSG